MATTTGPTITPDDKVVFLLSYLSNLVSFLTGPGLDYILSASVAAGLVKTQTPWQVVWGPAVLQYPADGYALNAMYVASPIGQPTRFVVAMAGTNIPSALDWFLEDFNVAVQVPWPQVDGAAISMATASGLSILLTMAPSAGLPGAGLSLPQFLAQITRSSRVQVETTGHSLGGTLSPALALWLVDQQGEPAGWDPNRVATVSTMPSAGATPGNVEFANYYASRLGATTRRFINSLDPVQHWWAVSTLAELPMLFAPAIPESRGISTLVELSSSIVAKGNYAAIVPDVQPIVGTVNPSLINPAATPEMNWMAQMGYQHTTAYYIAFGLPSVAIPSAPLVIPPPSPHAAKMTATPGTRMLAIGKSMVEMPRGADDPRTADVIAEVTRVLENA